MVESSRKHRDETTAREIARNTELEVINKKHQNELAQQREQLRRLELKYLSEQPKLKEEDSPNSSPEQLKRKLNVEIEHQKKMADLEQENDDLKRQIREVQYDLEHQKELYGQLQVQVMAKRQLTGEHISYGDVGYNII